MAQAFNPLVGFDAIVDAGMMERHTERLRA
jgi:hypothetical protein